eukprot:TRINITY_DN3642_c0_g2_i2.p1 TRINITY_DN3642_c0_g2~~TRINITY_DN3642_c0_g2_i2.p1  ORF type:complete len:397 (-),score=98.24 TRINITY_DN3642_c0_g2_i2:327-1517(-)
MKIAENAAMSLWLIGPKQSQRTAHHERTPSTGQPVLSTKRKASPPRAMPKDSEDVEQEKSRQRPTSISIKVTSIENLPSAVSSVVSFAPPAKSQKKEGAAKATERDPFQTKISLANFTPLYVIGRGGFGKVWKVEVKKTKMVYAMKEMSKARVLSKRSVNSVMNERLLLSHLRHPFLVNMVCAFQDRENIYLIMDLVTGGDLRFHVSKRRLFTEEQTRFVIACILLGLEYLHNNGVLHRDVKPENVVLDSRGYCKLTDLGIARIWRPDNAQDTSGTPGYMAPEVMCRQNHGVAVDYFALGVIAYEMMMGRRPYQGKSRKEIKEQVLARQVQIRKADVPDGWSLEAADFVNRLIQRKPANRLGLNGPMEVKGHPWLKNFPWTRLLNKELTAPFLPSV